jgi:hypothetical protein
MQYMYGVEMQVPAGKLPGFYAQVIHKIGDHVNVFDRDRLLFIVEQAEECEKLKEILDKAKMLGEQFDLLYIPEAKIDNVDDVGFVSQNERIYLYPEQVALFSLDEQTGDEQDRWAAREQLQEHLVGEIPATDEQPSVMIVQSSLTELAEGIARAYRISLHWLHR